jgi:hypothetical protein
LNKLTVLCGKTLKLSNVLLQEAENSQISIKEHKMKYHINNTINKDSLIFLEKLKSSTIKKLTFNPQITTDFFIQTPNENFNLYNQMKKEVDKDEYPNLVIEKTNITETAKTLTVNIGEKVTEIELIRDCVQWHYEDTDWVVQADIGIIIRTENFALTAVITDGLSTCFRFTLTHMNNVLYGSEVELNRLLSDFWGYKTDILDNFQRDFIEV